jgi:predicted DNA-binding protein (UPF0251 family)/predicted Fe-Mo cluster-binding NifX family protein
VVRPRKCRIVDSPPDVSYFKPRGVPLSDLNEIFLSVEGYEALRLADYHGFKHEDAAVRMQVSRQTFGRILSQARNIVAKALINGWALRIRGGDYALNGQEVPEIESIDKAPCIADSHAAGGQDKFLVKASSPKTKEINMTKIAITSEGPTLDDALDPRFGRAAGFIVVDPESLEFEYVDNGASQAMAQGAGIQAAENIARAGAKVLLTGYVGPKAFMALEAAGIKVAQNLENMTVRQAVEQFNAGQVEWAGAPNRMAHGR